MKHPSYRIQAGFSILEVLVALVVLSVGTLGMGKLMFLSMKSNGSAYMRSQATNLSYAMLDAMRANRADVLANGGSDYTLAALTNSSTYGTAATNCLNSVCSASQTAKYDVATWLAQIGDPNGGLPNGQGQILVTTANGQTNVVITVQWDDSVAQHALNQAITPGSVSLASSL
jgi:type IV pilus assembly protein PilV